MSEDLVAWARETFPAPVNMGPVTTNMREKVRAMADRLEYLEEQNIRLAATAVQAVAEVVGVRPEKESIMSDQATWELGNGAGARVDLRVRGVTIWNEDNIIGLNEKQLDRLLLLLQCLPGDGPPKVLFGSMPARGIDSERDRELKSSMQAKEGM